jgi:hypothetical protein
MLTCMKSQLTDCKLRKNKNFGFGSVLCTFFFERVPMMSLGTYMRGHVRPWPSIVLWTELLARLGGGQMSNPFDDDFFSSWERQVPFIEDYLYALIDYTHDPEVIIPPGDELELEDIGNFYFMLFNFCFLIIYYMYKRKHSIFIVRSMVTSLRT